MDKPTYANMVIFLRDASIVLGSTYIYFTSPWAQNPIGINVWEILGILLPLADSSHSYIFRDPPYNGEPLIEKYAINFLKNVGSSIKSYFKGESSLE